MVALEYILSINSRELWLQSLLAWLSEFYVNKLTTNRNLIIDIKSSFPIPDHCARWLRQSLTIGMRSLVGHLGWRAEPER